MESYNENIFKQQGIDTRWVQDNEAQSNKGVLRGLHYQVPPFAQAKLVRVVSGSVVDVVVDIRPESLTYGESFSVVLSAENKRQLYVPRGFAHGYSVLEDHTIFVYKCDNIYNKASEGGVFYADAQLNIDWEIELKTAIISQKDTVLPVLGQHKPFL